MRIAIIGSGISGLVSAHLLHPDHEIKVFEAGDHVGGHTCTVPVRHAGRDWNVDTGFVVFNEVTYPNFVKILKRIGVESKPTCMSFSVKCRQTGLEYSGRSLNALFAQRRNILRLSFLRMLWEIQRFNREAREAIRVGCAEPTLGEFFSRRGYSREFLQRYVLAMGAAIWSASAERMLEFPTHFFLRFFQNHGLLQATDHLQWRVIQGGSKSYVEKLIAPFRSSIHLRTPVRSVRRRKREVEVVTACGAGAAFDEVIFATHSDQALRILDDPEPREREILGCFPYQKNEAVLHTDCRLLPENERARASWNYLIPENPQDTVAVTYDMRRLQGLDAPDPFLVSLNVPEKIEESKILRRIQFTHPLYTQESVAAQSRHAEISGVNRTHYCGAYWGNGFHEDGVNSALAVGEHFGARLQAW